MKCQGYAFFVCMPRTVRDLQVPHLVTAEQPFEVVHTIILSALDYENFSEDLLVDRQFIEDYSGLCSQGNCFRCLLIKRKCKNEGILVVPELGAYVKRAAFIRWEGEL